MSWVIFYLLIFFQSSKNGKTAQFNSHLKMNGQPALLTSDPRGGCPIQGTPQEEGGRVTLFSTGSSPGHRSSVQVEAASPAETTASLHLHPNPPVNRSWK